MLLNSVLASATSTAVLATALSLLLALTQPFSVQALKGVDVSDPISVDTWNCLINKGYSDFAVVRVFQSINRVDPNAFDTIRNARAAGIKRVEGYFFPDPKAGDPRGQVQKFVNADFTGGAAVDMVWLDIEGENLWVDTAYNRQFVSDLIDEFSKTNYPIGVYTSKSQWEPLVGGGFSVAANFPLWYAHYDNVASLDDFFNSDAIGGYGGWNTPQRKQYNGDLTICGADVDISYESSSSGPGSGLTGGCKGDSCYVGRSCKANGKAGKCELKNGNKCGGGAFFPGICPGSSNVQCCIEGSKDTHTTTTTTTHKTTTTTTTQTGTSTHHSDTNTPTTNHTTSTTPDYTTTHTTTTTTGHTTTTTHTTSTSTTVKPPPTTTNTPEPCYGDNCFIGKACSSNNASGSCQLTNDKKCSGTFVAGLCPGSDNVKCCVDDKPFVGKACKANGHDGLCELVHGGGDKCKGSFVPGFCPGTDNLQCCIEDDSVYHTTTTTTHSPTTTHTTTTSTHTTTTTTNKTTTTTTHTPSYTTTTTTTTKTSTTTHTPTTTTTTTTNPTPTYAAQGRPVVEHRAKYWVDAKLTYCQAPNGESNWPNDYACSQICQRHSNSSWDPYRSDCSGFISWAWNLPPPGRTTLNFAPFETDNTYEIPAHDLMLGDAVNNHHHVMLFIKWDNAEKTQATFWEEPGCSSDPNHARPWSGAVTLSGSTISIHGRDDFTAIRHTHIDSVTNEGQDAKYVGTSCKSNGKAGTCQLVNDGKCHGSFMTGACPGSANVKCCV